MSTRPARAGQAAGHLRLAKVRVGLPLSGSVYKVAAASAKHNKTANREASDLDRSPP